MISVSVAINGTAIFTRSASLDYEGPDGVQVWKSDDGSRVSHRKSDGVCALGQRLLLGVIEQGVDPKVPESAGMGE